MIHEYRIKKKKIEYNLCSVKGIIEKLKRKATDRSMEMGEVRSLNYSCIAPLGQRLGHNLGI